MRSLLLFLSLFLFLISTSSSSAENRVAAPKCGMTETSQLSISFNWFEDDISKVKGKFDKNINEIEKIAKEMGVEKISVQSLNYNISSQNYGSGPSSQFQLSGSVSFLVSPVEGAEKLLVDLVKKNYQASLNVSSYRGNADPMSCNG